jgi:hypothetical protein
MFLCFPIASNYSLFLERVTVVGKGEKQANTSTDWFLRCSFSRSSVSFFRSTDWFGFKSAAAISVLDKVVSFASGAARPRGYCSRQAAAFGVDPVVGADKSREAW